MKNLLLYMLIALCLPGSGCRLIQNAWWTTVAEPIQYPRNLDAKLSRRRFTSMAEVALEEATATARAELDDYDCIPYSVDHQAGFIDGYVDYLDAGGINGVPPLPPRRYWRGRFQNPFGYQRIQDWFEGYEHGAAIAKASNYRTYVVVPTTDAIVSSTMQTVYGRISAAEEAEDADTDADKDANDTRFEKSADTPRRLHEPAEMSRLQRTDQAQ